MRSAIYNSGSAAGAQNKKKKDGYTAAGASSSPNSSPSPAAGQYDKNTDYKALMDAAIAAGDYKSAAQYEQQRNAKIAGEGITGYQQTHDLGSVYDAQHMTNDELGAAYLSRLAYQSGQSDAGSSHDYVEGLRKNYGYSGGADGSQYIPIETPQKYQPAQTFSYQSAPTYVNKYQDLIDELSGKILNRDPFSYDAESDPLYQQYRESYTRSGERAMQDTMGQLAARTGGLASSYAGSVGQQTYDGYMSALAGKIPELQQLAYSMYQDEGEKQRLNLQMISALEQGDYAKYQDLLSQYNTDRSFSYGQYRDQISDDRYADETAYNRGVYADETAYNRGIYADETEYNRNLQRAEQLAAVGDFSGYQALGYSEEEIQRLQAAFLIQHPELAYLYQTQTDAGGGVGLTSGMPSQYWTGGSASLGSGSGMWDPGTGGYSRYTYSLGSDVGKDSSGSGSKTGSGTGSVSTGSAAGDKAADKSGKDTDYGDIYALGLGIGPVSDSHLDQLIAEGKVMAVSDANGVYRATWINGWNSKNYKDSLFGPFGGSIWPK